ncbi:HPP family protein [Bordetella sp. 15P40C-2]|uniref:HPP family protein n=1 Tax=Bordetella sp. 15P40C-2 TaxID=2572246 RepID=UPI001321246B|nr:HPP family protein [Bordetella sp. 15P40C-2]MVW73575.1 CBS domain-containing protein [Bordetella sp. 15P40C-2]
MAASRSSLSSWLMRFWPQPLHVPAKERLRACVGILIGLLVTGVLSTAVGEPEHNTPLLLAPIGASAVLLFAVPSSPLAQPWPLLAGNVIAALVGVTVAKWLPDPMLATCVAVTLAIGLMFMLRCVHPPSGAIALTAVLGDASVHDAGYAFVLNPVLLNSCLMLACALLYHAATRGNYPYALFRKDEPELPEKEEWAGLLRHDIDEILQERGELLAMESGDIYEVARQALERAQQRRTRTLRCGEVMVAPVATLAPDTSVRQAWKLLKRLNVSALPVVGEGGRYLGMVTQLELLRRRSTTGRAWPLWPGPGGYRSPLRGMLAAGVVPVSPDTLISAAATRILKSPTEGVPVVDSAGRLVGMLSVAQLVHDSYLDPLNTPTGPASGTAVANSDVATRADKV